MKNRCTTWLLCLLALVGVTLLTGCQTSAAQRRQRELTVRTDRESLKREVDWILGYEDPSILWDYSFPPYW